MAQVTTGLGTPTQVNATGNSTTPNRGNILELSLTNAVYPSTFQLNPSIVDVSGAPITAGTAFVIASVAASTPIPYVLTAAAASTIVNNVPQAIYTGTITGGASNAYAGRQFIVAGFVASSGVNNGTFQCIGSSATAITLSNANAIAETHAGTVADQTATAVYTGTITGGGSNAFAGQSFVVAGFVTNAVNNGTFYATASSATTLTLDNAAAIAETHAATATNEEAGVVTYVSYNSAYATVSATGLVTAVKIGESIVEIGFPSFNNGMGTIASSGNVMNGTYAGKIYKEMSVHVRP